MSQPGTKTMSGDDGLGYWLKWLIGAAGLFAALATGWANNLINHGKNAKRLDVVEMRLDKLEAVNAQVTEIRENVAHIRGMLEGRGGAHGPRHGA